MAFIQTSVRASQVVARALALGFKVFFWRHGIPSLVRPSFTACDSATPTLDTGNNETSLLSIPNEFTETLQPVVSCPALSFPTECCYSEWVAKAKQVNPTVGHTTDIRSPVACLATYKAIALELSLCLLSLAR